MCHTKRLLRGRSFPPRNADATLRKKYPKYNQHGANRAQAENQGKLEQVSNNTTAILSLLRRYQALSLAHAASSKLQAVLGVEPATDSQSAMPLSELSAAIEAATHKQPLAISGAQP